MSDIDTTNKFLVGATPRGVLINLPPTGPITNDDALVLAAWLVVMADVDGQKFNELREAIENT